MKAVEVTLIGNPSSGGTGGSELQRIAGILRSPGSRIELRPTEGPGHATELAREAGARRVVVVGGDGTVNEAINSLSPEGELAVIPAGTANVLARELGLPFRPEDACRRALSGEVRRVDLGVATRASGEERRFSCMAGIGFDARVIRAVPPELKRWLKGAAFPIVGMGVYLSKELPIVTLSSGDEDYETWFAVVANVRRYGGDFRVAGETSLTSGTLEVVLLKEVGRLLRPDVLADLLRGRPLSRHATSFLAEDISTASGARYPSSWTGSSGESFPFISGWSPAR